MSEVDVISDELVYVVEPVEQQQLTFCLQDTDTCSHALNCVDQPLQCEGAPTSMTSSQTSEVAVRLRHRPPANASSAIAHRGSFYASGTLSANASREQSPDGQNTTRHRSRRREVRRICDYPVAPPSMIITPSRTPMRSQSSDRSRPAFNTSELLQRLSDIVDNKMPDPVVSSTSGPVLRGRSAHRADAVNKGQAVLVDRNGGDLQRTGGYLTGNFGRSLSVSPRTARRQFYDEYPTTFPRHHPAVTLPSNTKAPSRKAGIHSKTMTIKRDTCSEFSASSSPERMNVMTVSSSSTSQLKKNKNRMSLLRLPALPFFKKKNHSNTKKGSVDMSSECSVSSASDVADVAQQLRQLQTATEAGLGSLKDKHLSRSQPLQSSNLLNASFDTLTLPHQPRCQSNAAQLPPVSGVTKTTASNASFGSGLAARLMDPLKKRRQRVTSVGELPVAMTSSTKETVSVTSLAEAQPSHAISRSRRRVLSNAFMQGSL